MKSGFSSFSKRTVAAILPGVLGAAFAASLGACTPEPITRVYKEPNRDFGPTRDDGKINVDEIKMNALPTAASVRWKGDVETAAWYRASDDLGWLSRHVNVPQLGHLAYRMRESVVRTSVTWDHTFANSPYVSAAIGETRGDTKKVIDEAVAMLTAQEPILTKLLAERSRAHEWPTGRVSLVTVVEHVERFLRDFVRAVEASQVESAVKKEIVSELRINFGPRLGRVRTQVALAYNEAKVYDFVAKIREILKEEKLDLGAETNRRLEMAERLPRDVEGIRDARRALAVLVDFWMAASVETRETKFKALAPDLYDFFSDQSDRDLLCIKTGCGLFTRIKRILFILPKIESFGVDKIRRQLREAAEDSIRAELEEEAVKFLPGLHQEILAQITTELSRQKTNLTKISSDYGDFLRVVLSRMAVAKLGLKEKDSVSSLEPNRIRVDLDVAGNNGEKGQLSAQRTPSQDRGGFQSGAAAIGAGLSAALELHDHHLRRELTAGGANGIRVRQALGRTFFEQINKVLMIGGFKTESAKPFDALAVAIDEPGRGNRVLRRFNLRTLLSSDDSFAVPDHLNIAAPVKPGFVIDSSAPSTLSFGVEGQAELVRGLSRVAMSLRDWEATSFDEVLGEISLADFVPDLPRESVDQKLFPKDLFFAAAIGNAGAILKNMTKRDTPVGLIARSGRIHWSDQPDPESDLTKQAVMAAMFDIKDGVRSLEARSVDAARFLIGVADFLRATEGIDQTRASVLLEGVENGSRPVDQLISARQDLKLLVMALANFLSSEAMGPDGLVRPIFTRTENNVAVGMSGEPTLLDQAIVMRALLDASEVISAGIYRSAALDLLSATNVAFFRTELAFYADRPLNSPSLAPAEPAAPPSLETLAALLTAGERLMPHMTRERASQWTRISRPWINALRDAAETLP